jgi:hypothetical protein
VSAEPLASIRAFVGAVPYEILSILCPQRGGDELSVRRVKLEIAWPD